MCRSSFIIRLILAVSLTHVRGDCLPPQPFKDVVDATSLIVRIKTSNYTEKLSCGLNMYENGYVTKDEFPAYVVTDVFKADGLSVGEAIPIMWNTDTGGRLYIPDYVTGDGDFLAFMRLRESCSVPVGETLDSGIYVMNECNFFNKPWSEVSAEDLEYCP